MDANALAKTMIEYIKNEEDIENKNEISDDIKNNEVYTDTKWIEFILNKIIKNNIKFSR